MGRDAPHSCFSQVVNQGEMCPAGVPISDMQPSPERWFRDRVNLASDGRNNDEIKITMEASFIDFEPRLEAEE